ncbi:OLC1v1020144C1 [Oldenlandia corymbosa var. corymbosa]|uniref:OLC1v1020144C1 n=1 Tax=Oldenlandia corymbosa var. corymbosa TaxID=529605 RepID=A0AAV1EFP7_OLDCO|nr:OLC1v1020144C1 [Oldenlandia corymbosa var. corymbosa]
MASHSRFLLLSLFLSSILLTTHIVNSADEEQNLLQQINSYRVSVNLTALKENGNAKCLAEGMADEFRDQPCTNNTGANTVPGTETQFSSYPQVLQSCHLNVTTTRDGAIMPACVPNLVPDLVLSNFTQSQYASNLNDTKYTGIGIGSKNNWIVVVLTTDTPEGNYATATNDNSSANLVSTFGLFCQALFLSVSFWMMM